MIRWFPMPWVSGFVFLGWVMLNGNISVLSVLAAVLLAWFVPRLTQRFMPDVPTPRGLGTVVRLFWVVLYDIIRSNIAVAKLVLGDTTQMRSVFVTVPVDTDNPLVINLLASFITMTPGTVSARIHEPGESQSASIVVHALDCDDDAGLIADIKTRYEQPLMEIFGCSPSQ
ncbi:MAG: Na+/H+ antiporter subunit E [Burkholderiaceae bacterium]